DKFERGFDLMLNVLGADLIEEAKDVKASMGALGYDQERLQHVIHQFLKVVQGGEVIRGSTRSGEYLALDDLLDMLLEHTTESFAVDVVRYFTLAHNPNTHMTIDVDAATQQTNENPVFYIQNAHVRCAGIAREAADRGLDHSAGDVALLTDPQELRLIRKLVELPEIIQLAADELEPHRLAYWAQEDLAATFHPVYDEVRAIHTEVPEALTKARLKLYAAAQVVLRRVLDLMGMSAPERM
ncbi:MAG: DALR anticodon-binding domain-containing protein, partial [Anaerolineae bacterium]